MNTAISSRSRSGLASARCSCRNSAGSILEPAVIAELSLRVGCRRFLEESRGDRTCVYTRAVTTSYTTLLDST